MITYTPHTRHIPYTHVFSADNLAHILLVPFPATSTDARRLVSLVLESVREFFDEESVPALIDSHMCEVIRLGLSDYLMALASRIGVDLKNARWTGNAALDVRMMYTRAIFKLTSDLLDDTHGEIRSRIQSAGWSLESTQKSLNWTPGKWPQDQVESASDAYHVQRGPGVTLDEQERTMRRKHMTYRRLMRTGASLKSALRGKKSSSKKEKEKEIEEAEKLLAVVKAAVWKQGWE